MKRFLVVVVTAWLLAAAGPVPAAALDEARSLYQKGQLDLALETLDGLLESAPEDTEARFLKGVVLAQLQRVDEALAVFRALTRERPDLPEPYNNLAVLHAARGEYDRAREALVQAVEAHPDYATAYENLGDIYAKLATSAYERSLELDDSNRLARDKLALVQDVFGVVQRGSAEVSPVASPALPPAAPAAATSASAPAARMPDAERTALEAEALDAVNAWAAAWAAQDVDGYLAHYVEDYRPPDGGTHENWASTRRARLTRPSVIEVELSDPTVTTRGADAVDVTFTQRYRSDTYRDVVRKRLALERRQGGWKITSEQVVK